MRRTMMVLMLMVFCSLAAVADRVSAQESRTYTSSSVYNFSISYPAGWDIKEMGNAVIFLSPAASSTDTFRENVNVFIEDLRRSPMTLENYMKLTETNGPKLMKGFKVLDKGPTIIGDQKAELTIYEGEVNNVLMKFRAYTLIKDDKAFTLTYTALPDTYNQYLADAESVAQTIVFK